MTGRKFVLKITLLSLGVFCIALKHVWLMQASVIEQVDIETLSISLVYPSVKNTSLPVTQAMRVLDNSKRPIRLALLPKECESGSIHVQSVGYNQDLTLSINARIKPAVVFDLFNFNTELAMLEIRLRELSGVVDWFIINEQPVSTSGRVKPRLFRENMHDVRFKKFLDKILLVNGTLEDGSMEPGAREQAQWVLGLKYMMNLPQFLSAEQVLVIFSDLDEVPKCLTIQALRTNADLLPKDGFVKLRMPLFYYSYRWKHNFDFANAKVFTREYLRGYSKPFESLFLDATMPYYEIPNSGFHCSYCMSAQGIVYKLQHFLHVEYSGPPYTDVEYVRARQRDGKDLFMRDGHSFELVRDLVDLPYAVREEPDRFQHLIPNVSGEFVVPVQPQYEDADMNTRVVQQPRIFYFAVTHHSTIDIRQDAAQRTWCKRIEDWCGRKVVWYSNKVDPRVDHVISYDGVDDTINITWRMLAIWKHVAENYAGFDWYTRLWDDNIVFPETFEALVIGRDPVVPVDIGRLANYGKGEYLDGGAGSLLSSAGFQVFSRDWYLFEAWLAGQNNHPCAYQCEDVLIGLYMSTVLNITLESALGMYHTAPPMLAIRDEDLTLNAEVDPEGRGIKSVTRTLHWASAEVMDRVDVLWYNH